MYALCAYCTLWSSPAITADDRLALRLAGSTLLVACIPGHPAENTAHPLVALSSAHQ